MRRAADIRRPVTVAHLLQLLNERITRRAGPDGSQRARRRPERLRGDGPELRNLRIVRARTHRFAQRVEPRLDAGHVQLPASRGQGLDNP